MKTSEERAQAMVAASRRAVAAMRELDGLLEGFVKPHHLPLMDDLRDTLMDLDAEGTSMCRRLHFLIGE